eukprot:1141251-Pelagomonas_calceolata.AAC.2
MSTLVRCCRGTSTIAAAPNTSRWVTLGGCPLKSWSGMAALPAAGLRTMTCAAALTAPGQVTGYRLQEIRHSVKTRDC